jgi:Zn-dependent M16 (insulinase) family peptidase
VVIGKPSSTLAETLEKEEKARVATQVKALGSEGLAKAAKELEDAKQEHDKPIPAEVLESFPVPDVKSISWIKVYSAQEKGKGRAIASTGAASSSALKKHIDADGHELPFFVEYDHVQVS